MSSPATFTLTLSKTVTPATYNVIKNALLAIRVLDTTDKSHIDAIHIDSDNGPDYISVSIKESVPSVKAPAKTDTPSSAPSEEQILSALASMTPPIMALSESNAPWFESLFPTSKLPTLNPDSSCPKEDFNPLFKDLCSKAKTHARTKTPPFAHLPKSVAAQIQKVIIMAIKKSTESKAPARIIKKAAHLTPPVDVKAPRSQTASSSKIKSPPSKQPASKEKPVKVPSTKTAAVSTSKKTKSSNATSTSTTPSSSITPISDVIKALQESSSPSFYFSADKTPTFQMLFPGTTQPKHSYRSGNVSIPKEQFSPLLSSRVKQAHDALHRRNIKVTKLPSKFLSYQTRLICRSIEQSIQNRKDKAQSKKTAKTQRQSKKSTVTFVPGTLPSSVVQSTTNTGTDPSDAVFDLRTLRTQLRALKADVSLPIEHQDLRILKAIQKNPALDQFATVPLVTPYNTQHPYLLPDVTVSNAFNTPFTTPGPDFRHDQQLTVMLALCHTLLPVVESRTSLSYESML